MREVSWVEIVLDKKFNYSFMYYVMLIILKKQLNSRDLPFLNTKMAFIHWIVLDKWKKNTWTNNEVMYSK